MKNIKNNMLNEKMGIPDGINQQADYIYNDLIENIKNVKNSDFYKDIDDNDSIQYEYEVNSYNINISDVSEDLVSLFLRVDIIEHMEVEGTILTAAGYNRKAYFDRVGDEIKSLDRIGTSYLSINLISNKLNVDEIVSCFDIKFKETIAHELMHLYQSTKYNKTSLRDMSDYRSYQSIGGFPNIINEFLYLLYFMTSVENSVRATEIYQNMIDENITKDEFSDFMKNSDIMKKIRSARDFSLDEFMDSLRKDVSVSDFMEERYSEGFYKSEDIASDILKLLFINISNNSLDDINKMLHNYVYRNTSFFSDADPDAVELADKEFNKHINGFSKYRKDSIRYYTNLIKSINLAGDKMNKKLNKLYDMVKDNKNESIINKEMHYKLNKSNVVLDFKYFKNK